MTSINQFFELQQLLNDQPEILRQGFEFSETVRNIIAEFIENDGDMGFASATISMNCVYLALMYDLQENDLGAALSRRPEIRLKTESYTSCRVNFM
jgi:hypothetical protein